MAIFSSNEINCENYKHKYNITNQSIKSIKGLNNYNKFKKNNIT